MTTTTTKGSSKNTTKRKALGRGIPDLKLSKEVRKLILHGKPALSSKEQQELDNWMEDYKKRRFGEKGFESWLAQHDGD